ncbi:MAG: putative metallo-hydrolase [Planctomycetaceae bacterium]|nr:putative metallo-hydrolase [Planctomycetaceae bacterium]
MPDKIVIQVIVSKPFMENTLIVSKEGRTDCVVVDPGLEPGKILQHLELTGLEPALFLLTHGHSDHIGGNTAMKKRWPSVPLVIGAGDAPMLTDPILNLSGLAGFPIVSPPADRVVRDLEEFTAAGLTFQVREIPGHSPGHVVYLVQNTSPLVVLGGDVLFEGSIGRTDFPGGSLRVLLSGIREKLYCLPDDTIVYPGHGATTTIGSERRTNPYCGENAGE